MRKTFRILLISLLVLGLCGTAVIAYLNQVVLPAKGKAWAEKSLSSFLGRKVGIRSIRIHPWYGVLIEGVVVEEDPRYGSNAFLEIERISGRILYLPFLKNPEILIPSIRIFRPKLRIMQDAKGIWNLESLTFSSSPNRQPGKFRVIVPKIIFEDSRLDLTMEKANPPFRVRFLSLDAELHLSLPAQIQWSLATRLASGSPNRMEINGLYDLKTHAVALRSKSALDLKTVLPILPAGITRTVTDLQGPAVLELSASGPRRGPFTVHGTLQSDAIGCRIALAQPLEASGPMEINVDGQWPQPMGSPPFSGWRGRVDLKRVSLHPVPVLGELREVMGRISLSSEGIQTDRITASTPNGLILTMSGSLSNDSKKSFAVRCDTSGSAEQIAALFPEKKAAFLSYKPAGTVEANLTAEGSFQPKFSFQPVLIGTLKNGSVELPAAGQLSALEGTFRLQPDLLTISKLKGVYREKPFMLDGALVGFDQPEVEARLSWDQLQAESRFTVEENQILIDTFSGRYGEGTFRLSGKVSTEKGFSSNLYGEMLFSAEDLRTLLPSPPEWLTKNRFKGPISGRWMIEGPLMKPASWNFGLKTTCADVVVADIPLEQVSLEIQGEPNRPIAWSGTALLADGQISTAGAVNTREPETPWRGRLRCENVEMASLARKLEWKTQDLSGRMTLQFEGSGKNTNLTALQGAGKVEIRGGRIGELPFLGGFADMIRLPTLRTIVLNEATGTFSVKEGRILTKDLELKAPQMALNIVGTTGFLQGIESPLNLKILPTLSPELIPQENRLKLGKVLAKGTSYFVGEVRVTGTWKEPKKKFVAKPITQILNEQIFNLQDIFKDLF